MLILSNTPEDPHGLTIIIDDGLPELKLFDSREIYHSVINGWLDSVTLTNGRWLEAEPVLLTGEADWAYFYACDIIKKRWPEAEPFIFKDERTAHLYKSYFKLY